MAVQERVKSIIVEQLGVDEEEVTLDASFTEDLGADSLAIVAFSGVLGWFGAIVSVSKYLR